MMEERGSRLDRDRLFACIDAVPIFLARDRRFTKVENAILSMEDGLTPLGLELCHHFWKPDPEVYIGAVFDVLGRSPRDLRVRKLYSLNIGHG